MTLLNKTFIEKVDTHKRRFFWHGNFLKKGYYMVKWTRVCRSKNIGGLGIKNLRRQNISLLCKWLWKLETHDGMWQDIVKVKYLRGKQITDINPRVTDSPSWKAIMKVREVYYEGRRVLLNKGNICHVWKDPTVDGIPFCRKLPALLDICQVKDCTFEYLVGRNFNLTFRRNLIGVNSDNWNSLVQSIRNIPRNEDPDVVFWALNKKW
jgi:hypothetical protein